MNRIFRFLLLLLPSAFLIAAFYLVSRLPLSIGGQELAQIAIVAVTSWLSWRWVINDEIHNMGETRQLEPIRNHYRMVSRIQEMGTQQNERSPLWFGESTRETASRITSLQTKMKNIADMRGFPEHILQVFLSVGIVFALTIVMRMIGSETLGEGVIAILYLAPIGYCTARWGKLPGVSAALTAALSFDFLFIPPYGTFTIGRPEGWLLWLLFSATAILVVGRIQALVQAEQERERKATLLYEVVAAMINQTTREGIARAVANQIQQEFLAKYVQVHLTGSWGFRPFTAYAGDRNTAASQGKPERTYPIESGSIQVGGIDIWQGPIALPAGTDPMLQTMLHQTAVALDRVCAMGGKPSIPQNKPSLSEGNSLQAQQF